jgi:hypothetical protein
MTVNLNPLSKNFLTSSPYNTVYSNPINSVNAVKATPLQRTVKPLSTSSTTGQNTTSGTVSGGSGNTGTFNQGVDVINQNANEGNDLIDQDYNNAMNELAGQEELLNSTNQQAQGELTNQGQEVNTQLSKEKATNESGVQSQLSTGEKNYTSNIQQARDIFNQVQQKNVADLSALGISSSSVAEALAERLGVETARRIAGATGTINLRNLLI